MAVQPTNALSKITASALEPKPIWAIIAKFTGESNNFQQVSKSWYKFLDELHSSGICQPNGFIESFIDLSAMQNGSGFVKMRAVYHAIVARSKTAVTPHLDNADTVGTLNPQAAADGMALGRKINAIRVLESASLIDLAQLVLELEAKWHPSIQARPEETPDQKMADSLRPLHTVQTFSTPEGLPSVAATLHNDWFAANSASSSGGGQAVPAVHSAHSASAARNEDLELAPSPGLDPLQGPNTLSSHAPSDDSPLFAYKGPTDTMIVHNSRPNSPSALAAAIASANPTFLQQLGKICCSIGSWIAGTVASLINWLRSLIGV